MKTRKLSLAGTIAIALVVSGLASATDYGGWGDLVAWWNEAPPLNGDVDYSYGTNAGDCSLTTFDSSVPDTFTFTLTLHAYDNRASGIPVNIDYGVELWKWDNVNNQFVVGGQLDVDTLTDQIPAGQQGNVPRQLVVSSAYLGWNGQTSQCTFFLVVYADPYQAIPNGIHFNPFWHTGVW